MTERRNRKEFKVLAHIEQHIENAYDENRDPELALALTLIRTYRKEALKRKRYNDGGKNV